MFRSQIDHHQGGTIFFLTSVTKFYFILFIDVAACLQVTIKINLQQVKKADNLNSIQDNTYELIYFLLNLFLLSLAGMLLHQSIKYNKI